MDTFIATLFAIICVLLIVVVLLQKGRGVGLSGVFGGLGQSAFGTRTGDVFTWVTIVLTGVFLLLAIGAIFVFTPPTATVATPTFSPAGKPIARPNSIALQCVTGGTKIYYTLDGSDPTEQSRLYDSPVRVQPGQTIKARAYRPSWLPSEIAEAAYPLPTATSQAATATASAPATAPAGR